MKLSFTFHVQQENNYLLFANFLLLLILLCAAIAGAVMLYFQNLDFFKPSLVSTLKSYVPHPQIEISDDPTTSAWDDVQKQVSATQFCSKDPFA